MSESLGDLLKECEFKEPQIVGNIAMIGVTNPNAPEDSDVQSLGEALKNKTLKVDETGGGFSQLRFTPQGPTLLRASEGLTKGGRQDRIVQQSRVVNSPQTLQVYCIEHGRWATGDKEWENINLPIPIRRAILDKRSQSEIWSIISEYLKEWKVETRSSALAAIFDALGSQFEKFVANFEWWQNQVGMIVVINGVVSGLEYFVAKNKFRMDGMKVLRDSYVPEALRGDKVPMLVSDVARVAVEFIDQIRAGSVNDRRVDVVRHEDKIVYASII